ncbi:TMEM175 family protein [Parasediminibacterium sp. JCM 36343]|uniref:TMEM175 family protein n=1 Tax=Parasediminibacterium sp. JCM 36343 TaxID=3374279 RepID=UPI00397BB9B5
MGKGRLEAFSDGVIAIIITIMVLEMKVPHGDSLQSLQPLIPVAISYVLSFVNVGIYWNNHHHMLQAAKHINGSVLWANIHLLFWLSLFPFVSGWMGENHFAPIPVALYGVISLMSGVAYYMLSQCLIAVHGKNSTLDIAIGKDKKGIASVVLDGLGIVLSFINPYLGLFMYFLVACIWFIPDRRIEDKLTETEKL